MLTGLKRWWTRLRTPRAEQDAQTRAAQIAANIERARAAHGIGCARTARKTPRVVRRDKAAAAPKQTDVSFLFVDESKRN
jgi:hypothetical protein